MAVICCFWLFVGLTGRLLLFGADGGPILEERSAFEQQVDRLGNVIVAFVQRHQSFVWLLVRENVDYLFCF